MYFESKLNVALLIDTPCTLRIFQCEPLAKSFIVVANLSDKEGHG